MAGEKILIIEDEQDVASMIDKVIRERGYHTVVAHDGLSGLDLALEECPDLILLDLRLPMTSGVELLSQLREHRLDAPAVVLTAPGLEELPLRSLRMGVKDFVASPFEVDELLEVVERALEEERLRREKQQRIEHVRESQDQMIERTKDLKVVLSKMVRLQRISLAIGMLTSGADLRDVYRRLTQYAARLLEAKRSAILLFDPERQELVCQEAAFGITADQANVYRIPLGPASPLWDAWEIRQTLIINDPSGSPLAELLVLADHIALHSAIVSVMRIGGHSIGMILVADKRDGGGFTKADQEVLELFSSQSAIAIENARLFTTERRRASEMETMADSIQRGVGDLRKINTAISSNLELDEVLDGILQSAMSVTGAPDASILMLDEESGAVIAQTRRGNHTQFEKVGPDDLTALAADTDIPVVNEEEPVVAEAPWLSIYWRSHPDARSWLYIPIVSGSEKKRIGFLGVGGPQMRESGADGSPFLKALAGQAAIAIQNARYLDSLKDYQEQHVEAERIAAMADAAGNMVHRINNAVGAIRPLVQQIEMKLDRNTLEDAYLREKLEGIRISADNALEVARQIRLPLQSARLEPIDVNDSVAAAWAELKTPPAGIDVKIEYGEDLPPVLATRQLNEVFRNLMKNALDAMSQVGGVLSVHNKRLNDGWVEVTVKDTGPGMPPEIRDKIFHVGTTTKPGGTGFGLWWSRTFLRRLGGDIVLEKEGKTGCVFRVILPVCET